MLMAGLFEWAAFQAPHGEVLSQGGLRNNNS